MDKLEAGGEAFPIERQVVAILLRIFAFRLGSLLDLLAVFVESGEEERLATESGFDAGDDIRNDLFVGVPEVGLAVDVIDGSRDVEPFGHPGVTVKQGGSKSKDAVRGTGRKWKRLAHLTEMLLGLGCDQDRSSACPASPT